MSLEMRVNLLTLLQLRQFGQSWSAEQLVRCKQLVAKFVLRAGNVQFNVQEEELINIGVLRVQ
jgi:hypothetical protein